MSESAPLRSKALEEESEATPSGIQSDTPDAGESEAQSLPTRDYTSSATPTTAATSTWDDKKLYSASPDETSGAGQETSATTGESVAVTGGESVAGYGETPVLEDGEVTLQSAATRKSGMTIPSELNEKDETLGEEKTDSPCEEEVGNKEGVAGEDGGGVVNGTGEGRGEDGAGQKEGQTGVNADDQLYMEDGTGEKADDELYAEEMPIESMPGYLPWDKDSEMLSCYQERKDELSEKYKDYVAANPELFSILADFLQALFIQKPSDVYAFARDFFQPFARDAPHLPSHPTTINPDTVFSATTTRINAGGTSGDDPSSPHGTPTVNLSALDSRQQQGSSETTTRSPGITSLTPTA